MDAGRFIFQIAIICFTKNSIKKRWLDCMAKLNGCIQNNGPKINEEAHRHVCVVSLIRYSFTPIKKEGYGCW